MKDSNPLLTYKVLHENLYDLLYEANFSLEGDLKHCDRKREKVQALSPSLMLLILLMRDVLMV